MAKSMAEKNMDVQHLFIFGSDADLEVLEGRCLKALSNGERILALAFEPLVALKLQRSGIPFAESKDCYEYADEQDAYESARAMF